MRVACYCSDGFRDQLHKLITERSNLFKNSQADGSLATENKREENDTKIDILTRNIISSKLEQDKKLYLLHSIIKVICPVSSQKSQETIRYIQNEYPGLRGSIIEAEEDIDEISAPSKHNGPMPVQPLNVTAVQQAVSSVQQGMSSVQQGMSSVQQGMPAVQQPIPSMKQSIPSMKQPLPVITQQVPVPRQQPQPSIPVKQQQPAPPVRQHPSIQLQQPVPPLPLHSLPTPVQPQNPSSRISIDQIYRELEHPSVPLPELRQQVERLAANPPLQLCIVTLKKTELVEYLKQHRSRKKSPFVKPVSVKQLSPLPVEGNYIDLDKDAVQFQYKPVAELISVVTGKKTGYLLPITRRQLRVPHAIMAPRQVPSGTAVSVYIPLVNTQLLLC